MFGLKTFCSQHLQLNVNLESSCPKQIFFVV